MSGEPARRPDLGDSDLWAGSSTDGVIILGERDEPGAASRIGRGLAAAWDHPALERFVPDPANQHDMGIVRQWAARDQQVGWINLGEGHWTGAETWVYRDRYDHPDFRGEESFHLTNYDHLCISVGEGGVGRIERRLERFWIHDRPTVRECLFSALGEVCVAVCEATSAEVAFIGFDAFGEERVDGLVIPPAPSIDQVPADRIFGWVVRDGDGYRYLPPTRYYSFS